MDAASPTAKALLALELIQDRPGITAERLGRRLGVTDRAARRYVGILREAGLPIESSPGRYGGYRVGRGFRPPPLLFTASEVLGLVMAALEGHHDPADPDDPAGSALGKLLRVLPAAVAEPAEAIRRVDLPRQAAVTPDPEITATLVQSASAGRRVRLDYRRGAGETRTMEIDPWAVSIRHGRWYLLCWSHTADARRVLRVDRMTAAHQLTETFEPPADPDPVRTIAEHLSEGWRYQVEVVLDAPSEDVSRWIGRNLGRLEPYGDNRTRLTGSTDDPTWYAERLLTVPVTFHIINPPELRDAAIALAHRLLASAQGSGTAEVPEPSAQQEVG